MIRNVLSIIAGYTIFVVTSLALFNLSGQNPHADPTRTFVKLTAIYGAFFAFIAGLVTQGIGRTKDLKINYVLAVIIAGFAAFSYFKTAGNHWTQTLAICVFAPVSILGGLFYIRRYNK